MAASKEFWWPPARTFVSAYEENLMAADSCRYFGVADNDMRCCLGFVSSAPIRIVHPARTQILFERRVARTAIAVLQCCEQASPPCPSGSRSFAGVLWPNITR